MTTEQALGAETEPTQAALAPQEVPLETPTEDGQATETPIEGEATEQPDGEERQEVELPEGWQDHKEAKAFKAAGYQEAQSHFEKQHRRELRQREQNWLSEKEATRQQAMSEAVVQQASQAAQALSRKLQRDGMSSDDATEEVRALFDSNAEWAKVFDDNRLKTARTAAEKSGRNAAVSEASTWLYTGLTAEQSGDLADFVTDNLNLELTKGELTSEYAFQAMLRKRDELVLQAEEKRIEKLVADRLENERRAAERNGNPPPVKPTGRASRASGAPRTKVEAATLHAEGKLTNAEMRQIRDDPSIPEM